jgi:imidazole glycerol phosphate synthase, glutamine amidotransferase subunit
MIAIADYGMGNLRSVEKAFEFLGFETMTTENPDMLQKADRIILPGVGAFGQAMDRLNESGLGQALKDAVQNGTPLLGICLGAQLIFEGSDEIGYHEGLGLLKGTIKRLPDCGLKIPHMGWNGLETRECPLFKKGENPTVYFVHSYAMLDISDDFTVATCDYGVPFTAAVCKGNVMATQFHPEKSGDAGLKMLKNFALYEGRK